MSDDFDTDARTVRPGHPVVYRDRNGRYRPMAFAIVPRRTLLKQLQDVRAHRAALAAARRYADGR